MELPEARWLPARAVGAVVALVTAAMVLTGCLTTEAHVEVSDDGSGELRVEVFPPPAVSGALEASQVEALARDALAGVEGASFETKERTGQTVYIVKVPFDDYRELTTNAAGGATVAGQRLTPFSRFDLRELPDGGWSLDAVTNPLAQAVSFSEGSPLAGFAGLAAGEEAGAGLELSVTLPGRLTDSNAESQEDNTARWSLNDPTVAYELQMRTEATQLLSPLQWVLVGLAGIFVVGAVLMFVGASGPVRRKALIKPSRKAHEAFLPGGAVEPPKPPSHGRHRAKRRKRVSAAGRSGWENPNQAAPPDPGTVATGGGAPEGGVQPQRHLPPLGAETHPPGIDDTIEEHPGHGGRVHPENVLPLAPESHHGPPGRNR